MIQTKENKHQRCAKIVLVKKKKETNKNKTKHTHTQNPSKTNPKEKHYDTKIKKIKNILKQSIILCHQPNRLSTR